MSDLDHPASYGTEQPELSLMDRFFEQTSAGRLVAAFGQGAKRGFGSDRIGLSEETEKAFRDIGLFKGAQAGLFDGFKAFNEGLIRPAAAALDAASRGVNALLTGTAEAIGEGARQDGVNPAWANRLVRDVHMLGESAMVVTGEPRLEARPPLVRDVKPEPVGPGVAAASEPAPSTIGPVYHGTQAEFGAFEKTNDIGFHFTTDRATAEKFAAQGPDRVVNGETGRVVEAHLDLRNPLRIDHDLVGWHPYSVAEYIDEQGLSGAKASGDQLGELGQAVYEAGRDMSMKDALPAQTKVVTDWLNHHGYDGIVYPNEFEGKPVDTYIAFDNSQIKRSPSFEPPPAPDISPDQPRPMAAEQAPPERATDLFAPAEGVVDKAGNINLDRIAAPDDVKNVIRQAAQGGGFVEARRAPMSYEQISDLADAVGMTPERLLSRKVGEAFNAEEAVAARNLLVQSATKVRDLAAKAAGGSEADLLAFQEAMTKHMAIQEQVAGMTAEAGRALASFKIAAGEAKDVGAAIQQFGGRGAIEDIARKIADLDTPQQVSKFAMDARRAKTSDMLLEAWINALLSNPVTHVANTIGNTVAALGQIAESGAAAALGAARRAVGIGSEDRVFFGEPGSRLFGIVRGSIDGVKAGWTAYRTEITSASKLDAMRPRAIPSMTVDVLGRQIELGGKQVRIPGRLLNAEDEVFKAIAYRQELNARAYRQAAREGLAGDEFNTRVADLIENPTDAMTEAARENAEYQTFQTQLGKTGQAIQAFAGSSPLARAVVTFVRTPINLLKYATERTPLGLAIKDVRENLSGANGDAARDTQIARMAMGTALGVTTFSLAAGGHITGGGPADPRQRAVLYLNGWQPYSVRVGDMYYSYNRIDPFGTIMGVAADAYEVSHAMDDPEEKHIYGMIFASLTKNVLNKSWAQGPAQLINAVQDSERYGDRYIQQLAGSVVPAGIAQAARVSDPELKSAQSVIDVVKARIPGLSADLLPRRDIWGEPLTREGALGPDVASPIAETRLKNDPVNQQLLRLRIWPAPLEKQVGKFKLSPEYYDEFQRIAGRFTKYNLDTMVRRDGFDQLPAFAREESIRNTIKASRETASTLMELRHPEILRYNTDLKLKQLSKTDAAVQP